MNSANIPTLITTADGGKQGPGSPDLSLGPPSWPQSPGSPPGGHRLVPAQGLTSFCLEEWNPTVCPSLSNDARGVFARGRKRPGLSFTKGEPCVRAEPSVHRGQRADRCHEQEWRPVTTHGGRSLPVGPASASLKPLPL